MADPYGGDAVFPLDYYDDVFQYAQEHGDSILFKDEDRFMFSITPEGTQYYVGIFKNEKMRAVFVRFRGDYEVVKSAYDYNEETTVDKVSLDTQYSMNEMTVLNGNFLHNGTPIKGMCVITYPNSPKPYIDGEFKDGKPDGLLTEYYESGEIKGTYLYKNGVMCDTAEQYFESGALKSTTPYVEGIPHGTAKEFHENGQLKREISFLDGKPNGVDCFYSSRGVLALKLLYDSGVTISGTKYDKGIEQELTTAELADWDAEKSFSIFTKL